MSQLELIERVIAFVCARNHVAQTDADDFASHVKLKFVENNYALLAKFEGRSSLRTFLTVVIQRLFLDYRISAWGKWRPSAEARRAGPTAILLEKLMSRDGYAFEEAIEVLRTNHRVEADRAAIERLVGRLSVRPRRRFEPDDALADVPATGERADEAVAERERQATAEKVSRALEKITARLEPQDRLILALRFEDGRTIVEIASMLRLEQKALYRRVDRLLRELRVGLEAEGIDGGAVSDMMESSAVSIEWSAGEGKTSTRPSMVKGAQAWR